MLICTQHLTAVGPDRTTVARHLQLYHGVRTRAARNTLLTALATLDLLPHDRVPLPAPDCDPLPYLRAPASALQCRHVGQADTRPCNFLTTHRTAMRRHWNRKHDGTLPAGGQASAAVRTSTEAERWRDVQVQTFFTNNSKLRYFTVRGAYRAQIRPRTGSDPPASPQSLRSTQAGSSSPSPDPLAGHLNALWDAAESAERLQMAQATEQAPARDRTGWFARTKWHKHLQQYSDRSLLVTAASPPSADEPDMQEAVRSVDRVVEGAVQGLDTLTVDTSCLLKEPGPDQPGQRPLARMQNARSQQRTARYWARLVCYCLRLHKVLCSSIGPDAVRNDDGSAAGMLAVAERFPWHGRQKICCERIWELLGARQRSGDDAASFEASLDRWVLRLSGELIFQRLFNDPYQSGIVHFLAVLGIDPATNRLRTAPAFAPLLGALVYSVRVLSAEILLPRRHREEQARSAIEAFAEKRRSFLVLGSYSPMSVMLRLLGYAKRIAFQEPSGMAGAIWWSHDQSTLYFKGRPIPRQRFSSGVQTLVSDAESLLWRELLWTDAVQERFSVDTSAIHDDVTVAYRGASFLVPEQQRAGKEWLMRRLHSSPAARRLYSHGTAPATGEDEIQWKPGPARRYLRRIEGFLEQLLLCIHTTGGQPARGPEILPIRWRNGQHQDRNLYVMEHRVVVVTRYHKTLSQFDKPKVVPRFLPHRVSQLVLLYLYYVHPFRTVLENAIGCARVPASVDYLWSTGETPWGSDRLSKALGVATAHRLGVKLGIKDYRHVAIAVGRVVVGPRFAAGLRTELQRGRSGLRDGDSTESGDDEGDGEGEDPLELQAARTTAVGHTAYAVRADLVSSLSVRALDTFRNLSCLWHDFLGLGEPAAATAQDRSRSHGKRPSEGRPDGRQVQDVRTGSSPDRSPARRHGVMPTPDPTQQTRAPPAGALAAAARSVLGIEPGTPLRYRSAQQELGLTAVAEGVTPLLVVLPTAGGKTLLFTAVPAAERRHLAGPPPVTIVVLPYRALIGDMLARIRTAGLSCAEWRPDGHLQEDNYRLGAEIVLVSADVVGTKSGLFLTYAALLERQGVLRRVVLDECHVVVTSDHWRTSLRLVSDLRLLSCQLVLLTATLPPYYEPRLRDELMLGNLTVIRVPSTQRTNVRYGVVTAQARGSFFDAVLRHVLDLVGRHNLERTGRRAIVYCKAKAECERLATALRCPAYHADISDRDGVFASWVRSSGPIVATSALGVGIDVPGVAFTAHVDVPWTMLDFAQESGRVARSDTDLEPGESVVIVPATFRPSTGAALQRHPARSGARTGAEPQAVDDRSAMRVFVETSACRRLVMSSFMDGVSLCCAELKSHTPSAALCDNCGAASGTLSWQIRQSQAARRELQIRSRLDDLHSCCSYCVAVFLASRTSPDWTAVLSREQVQHSLWECEDLARIGGAGALDHFRTAIRYGRGTHVCTRCGMSQHLCPVEEHQDRERPPCRWPHVIVPFLAGLAVGSKTVAASTPEPSQAQGTAGFDMAQASVTGNDMYRYAAWIGQQSSTPILPTVYTSNGMATLVNRITNR